MLERMRPLGVTLRRAGVTAIRTGPGFTPRLQGAEGSAVLRADRVVNAAEPFFGAVAAMLGETLPVSCVFCP